MRCFWDLKYIIFLLSAFSLNGEELFHGKIFDGKESGERFDKIKLNRPENLRVLLCYLVSDPILNLTLNILSYGIYHFSLIITDKDLKLKK